MEEIELLLQPANFYIPVDFAIREMRLTKALRCAIQQRDKQYDWFEEPEAKKKKTVANKEIALFLKGVIQ